MSTWPIPPADLARQIINSHLEDIDHMGIGEVIDGKIDPGSLTDGEFDAYRDEVEQLISDAVVTITLPGDEVCPACGGTGQPSEGDGTPADQPQWEDLRALLEEHRDSALTDNELADLVMELFGGESA